MKKTFFASIVLGLAVCSAYADYVVLSTELEPYAKSDEVVSSFNTLTGDVAIEAGSNVSISAGTNNSLVISATGGTQVQADWNVSDTDSPAFIANKPTIPTVPTDVSSFNNDANYITLSDVPAQVQSDWDVTDTNSSAFIANKPTIPTVPTNVSDFTNDAGYITLSDIPGEEVERLPYTNDTGGGNISLSNGSEQYFVTEGGSLMAPYELTLPAATDTKVGSLTIYTVSLEAANQCFTFTSSNVSGLPATQPWTAAASEGTKDVWKIEFETIPGSTKWFYVKSTKYTLVIN